MHSALPWPSLADQSALAEDMFDSAGRILLERWLAVQHARIDDADFARTFSDHLDLPGIVQADYNHRLISTARGDLLGGIRFYGRDVARPFVEIVGHGFADLDALRACVRAEWSAFGVRFLRLHVLPGALNGPGVLRDNTIHAARYRDMRPPSAPVVLGPFADVEHAVALVEHRYAGLEPQLRHNVAPASRDDLAAWHDSGVLRAASLDGLLVGLFAAAPGAITWLVGDEVQEEVIDARFAGRGLAAAMQGEWARSVAADARRYLIGTIDRHNPASRRSAERAGRRAVLESVFVEL